MAFSAFSYPAVIADLSLSERIADLFPTVSPMPPGPFERVLHKIIRVRTGPGQ